MVDFDYMYKKYYNYIRAIVSRIIHADANDITQMAFVKLSQCTYATHESVAKEFLKTTAKRMSIDYLNEQKRKRVTFNQMKLDLGLDESNEQDEKEKEASRNLEELMYFIHKRIAQMPEVMRKVFEMTYFDGLRARQISKELNITRNTVWSHLHHARLALRKEVLYKKDAMRKA
jgi:RNA polymerase sigma-70 factor (ECF subfamily)